MSFALNPDCNKATSGNQVDSDCRPTEEIGVEDAARRN